MVLRCQNLLEFACYCKKFKNTWIFLPTHQTQKDQSGCYNASILHSSSTLVSLLDLLVSTELTLSDCSCLFYILHHSPRAFVILCLFFLIPHIVQELLLLHFFTKKNIVGVQPKFIESLLEVLGSMRVLLMVVIDISAVFSKIGQQYRRGAGFHSQYQTSTDGTPALFIGGQG